MTWTSAARTPGRAAAVVVVPVLLLAGCGGSGSPPSSGSASTTPQTPTGSPTGTTAGGGGGGKQVQVTETEYSIALSRTKFTPGTYTFALVNGGQATHALEIEGPGMGEAASDTLAPGDTTSMKVTLQRGTYELYCPVGNHKDLGMDLKITVG